MHGGTSMTLHNVTPVQLSARLDILLGNSCHAPADTADLA